MKIKNFLNGLLVVVTLAGAAAAYISANPAYTLVQAPSVQSIRPSLAVKVQHLGMDVDNITGLRFDVSESQTHLIFSLKELAPAPGHIGDMTNPTIAAYSIVRHERFGYVTDYQLTRINANIWSVAIPKTVLSVLPGDKFSLGAWAAGTNTNDINAAAYWYWWQL